MDLLNTEISFLYFLVANTFIDVEPFVTNRFFYMFFRLREPWRFNYLYS